MKFRTLKFISLIVFIVSAFVLVREGAKAGYLDQDFLRGWIDSFGIWGPAVYIFIYILSAALMVPGLPMTVLGGILFGPVLGTVYVSIGATIGATLAFLIARYLGREWVEGIIHGRKFHDLYLEVEKKGWKIVAFTRLIPIFPYNFLNYAFGLTKVKLAHYIAASFIFMLPGIVAYVVFSSSLLGLLSGKVSKEFAAGVALVILVSLIPIIYRKIHRNRSNGGGQG